MCSCITERTAELNTLKKTHHNPEQVSGKSAVMLTWYSHYSSYILCYTERFIRPMEVFHRPVAASVALGFKLSLYNEII